MELMTTLFRHILQMRQISMAVLVSLIAVAAFMSYISGASGRSTASDFKKAEAMTENKLLGTWKQVKGKFNGKEHQIPEGTTQLKHVTSTHFMFIDIDKDGKVFFALGGPYTLKGGEYVETPEYGVGEVFKILKGKPQLFECKVEGSKWYHNGTLSSGLTIEEVWERVEPK